MKKEKDGACLNRSVEMKRQRRFLKCDRCPPNKGCNTKRKSKYKSKKRESV